MRFVLKAMRAAMVAGLVCGMCAGAIADSLTVKGEKGTLRGKLINDGKVRAFLGIPYAAPPVGELRWKATEPAANWKGTRDATQYGARCMQGQAFEDMVFQDAGENEDCLYLNVFVPENANAKSKLPVMFWIHGGGYRGGSGSEPRHNGDFLPTKGVVLVTINYRLGVFGFLTLPELAREGNGATGNYGLMDMIAALHWVQDNIARFGGDPKNVTIFGESAGSSAVSTLMASAMAQGLFAKVIGESGSGMNVGARDRTTLAEREEENEEWMKTLGASGLAELRTLPAAKILAAATAKGAPGFSAVMDGRVLTEPVAETYAAGRQAHVPLLAGWNRDEGAPLKEAATAAKWKQKAENLFGDRAAQFLRLYPGNTDDEAERSAIDYGADTFIAFSTWKWVEAQVKTGNEPVYRYHFELPAPPSKFHHGSYAFHSDDIEYVFGTLDTRPGADWRQEDRKLSGEMMDYWTNFAKTGDPNGEGLPLWSRYDKESAVLHLDQTTTASRDTTRPRYEFLLTVPPAVLDAADSLTVKTKQGTVHGKLINDGKVRAFLGIPYAAPPVGDLRWRAPQPPAKWSGVRDATAFTARCPQWPIWADYIFLDSGPSEDCLHLHVYTPTSANGASHLPVMFWIHGGGYAAGGGSEPRYTNSGLPLRGVVLVTVDYRMGVFGFLASEDLAKEGGGSAGNYGLMDMVAGLRWVKQNIAQFGGDPNNVTIFGESAGSFAVSTLMAVPEAQGLFQKAIGESGAPFSELLGVGPLAERAKRDQAWVESLGVKSLAELKAMPMDKLLDEAKKKGVVGFVPVMDGRFLPDNVAAIYAAGKQSHVPLLAGWNRDERSGILSKGMTAEKWKAFAGEHYGQQADAFLAAFPGRTDDEAVQSADAYTTEQFIAFGTWKWVEAQVKSGGAPVYRYHFELPATPSEMHPEGKYAWHSDELEYVFGTLDTRHGAQWRPEDQKLSEEMMDYWTNFAKSGDPNGEGLPHWPRYDKGGEVLHLDRTISAGEDATRPQYEFLLKAPAGH